MTAAADRALFRAGPVRAIEAREADLPRLQSFFEANPEYSLMVEDEPPAPDAARKLWDARPPDDWPYREKRILLLTDDMGDVVGVADVSVDLFVPGVWHIGLFVVATWLHGTGTARAIYDSLEVWMASEGARWARLGVVIGNARAERFWERLGYVDVYRRTSVRMGRRDNIVRAMMKPLAGGGLAEYLRVVDHDRARVEEAGRPP
jgi:RimJ/RimL family protein N-acetyltransferase